MNLAAHRALGAACLLLTSAALLAQAVPAAVPTSSPKPASDRKTAGVHPPIDPGERAFQANCSRCHYPPESLSPRITGTVLRHMRVRANLSAEDERKILSYLNP